MLKFKINNIDILPYIIFSLVALCFLLFQLSTRNILKIKFEWELGCITLLLFTLGVINYIKKIHPPKGVNLSDLISTEDIRTPSYEYKGIINKGTNISFIKFYFSSNEVYMYYRNFLPIKIYYGPFIITKKQEASFNTFILKEFKKINTNRVKLHIESRDHMTSYVLYMENIKEKDFNLLEDHLINV